MILALLNNNPVHLVIPSEYVTELTSQSTESQTMSEAVAQIHAIQPLVRSLWTLPTEVEKTRDAARWLIRIRWLQIAMGLVMSIVGVKMLHLVEGEPWWPLVTTLGLWSVTNLIFIALINHPWNGALLSTQVCVDLAFFYTMVHFSGGLETPLSCLSVIHVVMGGILLARNDVYVVAGFAMLAFALVGWLEWAETIEHYPIILHPHCKHGGIHAALFTPHVWSRMGMQAALLFFPAYFIRKMAERAREDDRKLEGMAEREMAERRLLEQALETTETALCTFSEDRSVRWANQQWQDWFSSPDSIGPRYMRPTNGGATPPEREHIDAEALIRETFKDGRLRITECIVPTGDEPGRQTSNASDDGRVLQITTAPLRDRSGRIVEVVELAQDITEHEILHQNMMRAGKLAAVGELAGNVAHEVNNPISIIGMKARLLLSKHRDELTDHTGSELGKIVELSDRVARIAQGLLSYCRPSGAVRSSLNIATPIRNALTMVEQHARKRGIEVVNTVEGDLPSVTVNPGEVEQVFLNLFLNAMDAMPDGGTLTIAPSAPASGPAGQDPCLVIAVEDTGPGMSEETRERVFEPFFTTKEEGKGTGLGLSICQGIIRSHGGNIEIESEPGRGTRLLVELPAAGREATGDRGA